MNSWCARSLNSCRLETPSPGDFRIADTFIPLEEQERGYILWVLEEAHGNQTEAARMLGIDRVSLWRKLKKYGEERG